MKVTRAALPLFFALCRACAPSRTRRAYSPSPCLKATALEAAILRRTCAPVPVRHSFRSAADHRSATATAGTTAPPLLPTTRPPVVLLHGFIDNRSVFVLLRRTLAQHGRHQVESLNYSPLTCDIRTAAELLGRHMEEICERTGSSQMDIVGHSLGGLIARYYVQRLGGDLRVRTLVTLGTPHSGTARRPAGKRAPDRAPDAPRLADLIEELRRPAPGCRTRFMSFWSDLDQVMDPLETACVDHPDLTAQNVRVSGIGHLALPVHPAVATAIRQALDTSDRCVPPSELRRAAPGATSVA